MLQEILIPKIVTNFDADTEDGNNSLYREAIRNILKKVLPEEVFAFKEADADFKADQCKHFHAMLPIVSYNLNSIVPANLSFYVLHKYRTNAFKFFFEMISRWLVP